MVIDKLEADHQRVSLSKIFRGLAQDVAFFAQLRDFFFELADPFGIILGSRSTALESVRALKLCMIKPKRRMIPNGSASSKKKSLNYAKNEIEASRV